MSATFRCLLLITLLTFPFRIFAHRLDEYLQATLVSIEPKSIRLQINLTPGVDVSSQILSLVDADNDGKISAIEVTAYADRLQRDLKLRLDRQNLELKPIASESATPAEIRNGDGIIQMEFAAAPGALTTGQHILAFENRHQTNVSVYLVNAALPKSPTITIKRQLRNENQSVSEIEFSFQPASGSVNERRITTPLVFLGVVILVCTFLWLFRQRTAAVPVSRDTTRSNNG